MGCIMNKKQDNLEYVKGYGKNYADLRKKEYNHVKDYTVRELAVELLISSSTISKIENEKVYPTVEQVKAYKKFFHVSLDYLTGETKVCRTDLQMICEYTGLSEDTVRKLHKFATAGVEYGCSLYIKL
jgi:transcriptional regulator with XRE-family HTH domain